VGVLMLCACSNRPGGEATRNAGGLVPADHPRATLYEALPAVQERHHRRAFLRYPHLAIGWMLVHLRRKTRGCCESLHPSCARGSRRCLRSQGVLVQIAAVLWGAASPGQTRRAPCVICLCPSRRRWRLLAAVPVRGLRIRPGLGPCSSHDTVLQSPELVLHAMQRDESPCRLPATRQTATIGAACRRLRRGAGGRWPVLGFFGRRVPLRHCTIES